MSTVRLHISRHDSFSVWFMIEVSVGITAASLPTLKPLFNWALESARVFTGRSGTGPSQYYKHSSNSGYLKQDESFALSSMKRKSRRETMMDDYHADLSKGTRVLNSVSESEKGVNWEPKSSETSEECILPIQPTYSDRGIVRTTEVTIH